MYKEELLKMAREAGLIEGDFHPAEYFCVKFIDEKLEIFANAILERAAVECQESEMYRGSVFASRIRALKSSNDA